MSAHPNPRAEKVPTRAVASGELGLLFPTHASMHEHVGRPGRAAVVDSSDDDRVSIYGHGIAELVAAHAIARGELGLLLPAQPPSGEHIGYSYPVVLEVRPRDDGIPAYRHDGAEDITGHAIIGIELRLSAMVIWVAR